MPRLAYQLADLNIWRGKDAIKFLNGLSTNKIDTIPENKVISTIVLTEKAKILDVLHIFNLNNMIISIGSSDNSKELFSFINKKILLQDIQLQNISSLNNVDIVYGDLPIDNPNSVKSSNGITTVNIDGLYTFEIYSVNIDVSFEHMPDNMFKQWRIDNLIPWNGHEISSNKNPYQCGLQSYVHENKGCYTGQEILTRMRSRNKGIYELKQVKNNEVDEKHITTKGTNLSLALIRS
jgi:folate-binding protein YgfZ